jgi:hypothetical protein
MSAPPDGIPEAAAPNITTPPRDQRIKDLVFRIGMLTCLLLALAVLVTLIAQDAVKGIGSINADFFTN